MYHESLIGFLQQFKAIPLKDQELITAAFEPTHFNEGDYLFHSGHICRQFFFITSGILKITAVRADGMELTHFFIKAGQLCTILDSFEQSLVAEESIVAACPVTVLAINRTELLQLYGRLPYLKELIVQITRQALLDKIRTRNAYLGMDATARYRQFLQAQPDIAAQASQNDIASYLGMTPQSLSRIRSGIR